MACSTVRYGPGVTQEVGKDLEAMGAKKVLVMTDKFLSGLKPVATVVDSLTRNNVNFSVFDNVRIEPTDSRFVTQDKPSSLIMHAESFLLMIFLYLLYLLIDQLCSTILLPHPSLKLLLVLSSPCHLQPSWVDHSQICDLVMHKVIWI